MPLRRTAVAQQARQEARHTAFAAPIGGWVSATNLAAARPGTAQICENWLPTSTGLKMRAGSQKHGTASDAGDPLESLLAYRGANAKMFAASDGVIYDLTTPADPDAEPATASVSGQTSDYYAHVNLANPGGKWLLATNGTDPYLIFDGTYWFSMSGAISTLEFDTQTSNFTLGATITGGTSGHTGTLVAMVDNGTSGTLYLSGATGIYQNNETITGGGGSALANGTATAYIAALSGVDPDDLSHVNVYRSRVWFVERGTMNAWYLEVDAISGTATKHTLSGVFRNGGNLLFTATWSLDAGDGIDDKIVFVSDLGEVAVYQGDPALDDWGLVGRYDASPPMGKNAFLTVGGDLLILTKIGLVPLSAIIAKDPGALALAAVSRNIQPDWVIDAQERSTIPWEIVKWTSRNIAFIATPVVSGATTAQCYAVNLETGAWAKITGWDARCLVLHDDWVYFGTTDGTLVQVEVTGADQGETIQYTYVGHFEHLKSPGVTKTVRQARALFKTQDNVNPKISVSADYAVQLPAYPEAASVPAGTATWDSGLWDDAIWDTGSTYFTYNTGWVSIGMTGFAHAPQLQAVSGATTAPSAELIMFDLLAEPGGVAV